MDTVKRKQTYSLYRTAVYYYTRSRCTRWELLRLSDLNGLKAYEMIWSLEPFEKKKKKRPRYYVTRKNVIRL